MTTPLHEIMTKDISKARPTHTLEEAAQLMKLHSFGSLPVCEGSRVVGIITDRDLAIRGIAEGRDPGVTKVAEIMSRDLVSIHEDSNLQEAERLMHDHQLRRLPVVNSQGDLVGYLSMAKVARSERPAVSGKVIQGISQKSKPASMKAGGGKRSRKTG